MYDDLVELQDIVSSRIPVIGTLGYSDWRRCKGVIDGDILGLFLRMERTEQIVIAGLYIEVKEAVQLDSQLMDILDERQKTEHETVDWLCSLIERLDSIIM
jgi:hypothetical protein